MQTLMTPKICNKIIVIYLSLPPVICRRAHVLFTLSAYYKRVQHILCCVFTLFIFVYPMLLVSLDCPFMIVPSVFSNNYLTHRFSMFFMGVLCYLL